MLSPILCRSSADLIDLSPERPLAFSALPRGGVDLVTALERATLTIGDVRITLMEGDSLIAGATDRLARGHVAGEGRLSILRLSHADARRLFDTPLCEFTERTTPVNALGGQVAREVRRVATDRDPAESLARHLTNASPASLRYDRLISEALATMVETSGRLPVAAIARRLGVSSRTLDRAFAQGVGQPPKVMSNLVRLHHARTHLDHGQSIAEVAYAAGFYDQSHFTTAYRRFSGSTPVRGRGRPGVFLQDADRPA